MCDTPWIGGCQGCNCIRSRSYLVCLNGATGDAAVINNPSNQGWTVYDVAGNSGIYTFENEKVRIVFRILAFWYPLFPEYPDEPEVNWIGCWSDRDWDLVVYYKDSFGNWIEGFSADNFNSGYQYNEPLGRISCGVSQRKNGITYQVRPKERWFPTKIRVMISGFTRCGGGNCINTINPQGLQYSMSYGVRVHAANLDGVYDIELDSPWTDTGGNYCYYKRLTVGNYAYSMYPSRDCTGVSYLEEGQYTMMVRMENNGSFSVWVYQEAVDTAAASLMGDIYIFRRPNPGACDDKDSDFPSRRCSGILANDVDGNLGYYDPCLNWTDYGDRYGTNGIYGAYGKSRFTAGHNARVTISALD